MEMDCGRKSTGVLVLFLYLRIYVYTYISLVPYSSLHS